VLCLLKTLRRSFLHFASWPQYSRVEAPASPIEDLELDKKRTESDEPVGLL
jgi:hypothetical protein